MTCINNQKIIESAHTTQKQVPLSGQGYTQCLDALPTGLSTWKQALEISYGQPQNTLFISQGEELCAPKISKLGIGCLVIPIAFKIKIKTSCPTCQTNFQVNTNWRQISRNSKIKMFFCSKKCAGKYKQILFPKICPECNQSFQPRNSESVYCTKICSSKVHSRMMKGKWNSNWRHGMSRPKLPELRELILKRDNMTCSLCNIKEQMLTAKNQHVRTNLVVHHIDANPKNNVLQNLITVCRPCHTSYHQLAEKAKIVELPFPPFQKLAAERSTSMTLKQDPQTITSLRVKVSSV